MKYLAVLIFSILAIVSSYAQPAELLPVGRWFDNTLPTSSFYNNGYNEIWGVTVDGNEYAVIGSTMGIHFIDLADPFNPIEVKSAFVPGKAVGTGIVHRDMKDYNGYLYAVCDEGNSSLQIIDITGLPDTTIIVYDSDIWMNKSHNLYIDTAKQRLYTCGVRRSSSSSFLPMQIYDISRPDSIKLLANVSTANNGSTSVPYIHDLYVRNDTAYVNCGAQGLYVLECSDPNNVTIIGQLSSYPESGYNHSGWLSGDGKYYYMLDETHGKGIKILDISNLNDIEVLSVFKADTTSSTSIAHNAIWKDDKLYVSYYYDGLQIFDVQHPTAPKRIHYFDTCTLPDNNSYEGAWGVYPLLPSGLVLISDMQNGLFVFDESTSTHIPTLLDRDAIRLAANPTLHTINLQVKEEYVDGQLFLFNASGLLIKTQQVAHSSQLAWNVADVAEGLYYLVLEYDNKWIDRERLIIGQP